MMGMRLVEGLDLDRFRAISGRTLSSERISNLREIGMVELSDERIQATDTGRAVLNAVLRDLLVE